MSFPRRAALRKALYILAFVAANPVRAASPTGTFTNPVAERGADPWVIWHQNSYYYCQSRGRSIGVARVKRLQDLGRAQWSRVWTPPPLKPYSRELWAPELHLLDGRWFIYVAADNGQNENHRMYVLGATTSDPTGPFELLGKITTQDDHWAIDGTVVTIPGRGRYFVWSGWEGTENVSQNLYIAAMTNPWTLTGERVCISRPEHAWEQNGRPLINEGPQALWHGNKLFLIYSASGSWGDDYCLGQLTWNGGPPLEARSWVKRAQPVFSRTANVWGPGHCSFVKSRDGREDWMVYHAARRPGSGWDRSIRLQKFNWLPDGSPQFSTPVSPGISLPEPSGDSAP